MAAKRSLSRCLLFSGLMLVVGAGLAYGQSSGSLSGTWSGAFHSRHKSTSPFTMTVEISPDAKGHLVGTASLNSECLSEAKLHVTPNGSKVTLAGSDPDGDNVTFIGTLDSSGTLLTFTYIINASASGKCETDDGTGTLGKR